MISDLHLGNGSKKDIFTKERREELLLRLLDRIEHRSGRMIVLGDLLELWRHRLEDVLDRWDFLLDRLYQMNAVYVLGNHDASLREPCRRRMHRFFEKIQPPFSLKIGSGRFKFMHGHEMDPIAGEKWTQVSPLLRLFAGAFEFRSDTCLVTCDELSEVLAEGAEQCLRLWQWLTRQVNTVSIPGLTNENITRLIRPIRIRNMLGRFYQDRIEGFYDVAVTGHTHRAGRFGDWYYNSGCWTQSVPTFLKIDPDGQVQVLHWRPEGPFENPTIVFPLKPAGQSG